MKIRIGNDFVYLWGINFAGAPENLHEATDIKLYLKSRYRTKEIEHYDIVETNKFRFEFTPEIYKEPTTYNIELHYKVANASYRDGERRSAVDINAFEIVSASADADDVNEAASTSDVVIGLMGKQGNPMTWENMTDEEADNRSKK